MQPQTFPPARMLAPWAVLLGVVLGGCDAPAPNPKPAPAPAPAQKPTATPTPASAASATPDTGPVGDLRLGPVPGSWSVDALPAAVPGQSWVAATSHSEGVLALWAVDGQRQARPLGRYSEVGFHPDNVRWRDRSAGGRPELLVAAEGISQIQRWQADEQEQGLRLTEKLPVSSPPRDVVAADLDGDGVEDLVGGPYDARRILVLWGRADGTFQETFIETNNDSANHPRVGDWNGDGRPDLLWGNCLGEQVQVAINLGERRWEARELWHGTEFGCPRQVALADLDGDGRLDLIAPLENGARALVLYNDGQGGVAKIEDIPSPTEGYRWAAARPWPDALLALSLPATGVVLARREGEAWHLRKLPTASMPTEPVLRDLDGDGQLDLLVSQGTGEVGISFGPLWDRAQEVQR